MLVLRDFLNSTRVVRCRKCKTHFTDPTEIISKDFQGISGRAYLYNRVYTGYYSCIYHPIRINYEESEDLQRTLTTGEHVIREISCCFCSRKIGWKYISTTEESQRYKVGRFILEQALVQEADNEFSGCDAANGYVELDLHED